MSKEATADGNHTNPAAEDDREDLLSEPDKFISDEVPPGVDRRTFIMRSAVVGATAVMTGRIISAAERTERSTVAQTAKDMNSKYKETSEAGLALSVVLC